MCTYLFVTQFTTSECFVMMGIAKRNHKIFTIKEDSQLSKPCTHYVSGPEIPGTTELRTWNFSSSIHNLPFLCFQRFSTFDQLLIN